MEFAYDPTWVASNEARPLSLSLPINLDGISIKGDKVGFFFDNLLPDSDAIRQRIRARFHTRSGDAFDLLSAIGRDCVGALQLLPDGIAPERVRTISVTRLDELQVERDLLAAVSRSNPSFGNEDDFRISIAGSQEKSAFTRHEGHWCQPHDATPTTHIFKLPLGLVGGRKLDMSTSLENEWLCAQILAEYRLPIAPCEILQFGSTKALVVTRFDRALHSSGRYWLRLPQEDFCQATATPSSLKYESDGGPGLDSIARILQGSESRDDDLATLLRAQLLFWMLAATDGHAKNFSIHLLREGRYRLTPLYDVLSAWPIVGPRNDQVHRQKLRLAMAVRGKNKHYRIAQIQRRHFNMMARRCGFGNDMEPIILEVIGETASIVDKVSRRLPKRFPAKVFDAVAKGLRQSARQLEEMSSG
jgi:serine/threonine-protein kinase HipA